MRCLVLFTVLIAVATASARYASKKRGSGDDVQACYEPDTHPLFSCAPGPSTNYPFLNQLGQVRDFNDFKRVLGGNGALQSLCNEGGLILKCVLRHLVTAPEQCKQEYDSQDLTVQRVELFTKFRDDLCIPDTIRKAQSSVGCLVDETLIAEAQQCSLANPGLDCSEFEQTTGGFETLNHEAIAECRAAQNRRICDREVIVPCMKSVAIARCNQEAGEVLETIGEAFFNRFSSFLPCEDNTSQFRKLKHLLKYFK